MWSLLKARTEAVSVVRFDRRILSAQPPSSLILYALDVSHLVMALEPVPEYERRALFKDKARVAVKNGQCLVEVPGKIFQFYRLDEADYTVMASEKKPRTLEILL